MAPLDFTAAMVQIVYVQKLQKAINLFDNYYDMMADKVRMDAYEKAISKTVKEGDVVLDLGCGLGILSFLAIKTGAKKVYAVEKTDSINLAKEVARINKIDDRIVFIEGVSKEITLPEKVDVIISETLGSFAVEENTLEFTIDARERFLKEDGRMIPEALKLYLVPVENKNIYKKTAFWKDVAGFDFSYAKDEFTKRLLIEDISKKDFLSKPEVYKGIDLIEINEKSINEKIVFEFSRDGTIHGFAGWFEALLTDDVLIDTSPSSERTHWRQAFFPIKEPIKIEKGNYIIIDMKVMPMGEDKDHTVINYDYFCSQTGGDDMQDKGKIGRNDPCPCGSGKKYKKCCLPLESKVDIKGMVEEGFGIDLKKLEEMRKVK
ncbi:MAG: 50S ribosomal protein L11 methyltransferase [Deltaproteobacteria bacterium]|nr:50S ribosomal protein L11 methyltransferase [Deltaproteobacteria bacterium]